MLTALLGLNTDELAYRGNQLADWIYRRGARTFKEMTNLPDALLVQMGKEYEVGHSEVVTTQHSQDGTTKLLLGMRDGVKVETVGLPYADRFSCCLSTQVGCPIGCVFCSTGLGGYTRDLSAGEIVDQVLAVQELARSRPSQNENRSCRIDHVTFMGMGEPLLNYESTMKALRLLNEELRISIRHMTVSTVGFIPGIRRLAEENLQITLAVSLHAPTDNLRCQLIPKMVKWSVTEIIDTCRDYVQKTGRRVTFEYCLLGGVNDGVTEARELARVLHGLNCHVNLIPYNPVCGLPFHASSPKSNRAFHKILNSEGIQVTQRVRRGADIDAACGQLRQRTT
ncbi:23S rRNA (adenine(2503)-C(2))-methyltransferase RlmN [Chloroflexota bacterium]